MYNLIKADLYKLRKSLAIKVLFAITTVNAVAMTVIAQMIESGKLGSSMAGIGFMFSDVNTISTLGAVIAGIIICGDFHNKIMCDAISNGSSRIAVIISKIVVLSCAEAFILLPYAVITAIALGTGSKFSMGANSVGFLNLLTSTAGTAFSASDIFKLLAIMLTLLIVYAAQLSICLLLSFTLKKPFIVIAIYYATSFLSAQLLMLSKSSSALDRILSCTPFGSNYGFITLSSGAGDFFKAISVSLIFMIIIIAITFLAFRKSEIR